MLKLAGFPLALLALALPNHLRSSTAGSVKQAGLGLGPFRVPGHVAHVAYTSARRACGSGSPVAMEAVFFYFLEAPRCLAVGNCSMWRGSLLPGLQHDR